MGIEGKYEDLDIEGEFVVLRNTLKNVEK
jgi:hypothetical protein